MGAPGFKVYQPIGYVELIELACVPLSDMVEQHPLSTTTVQKHFIDSVRTKERTLKPLFRLSIYPGDVLSGGKPHITHCTVICIILHQRCEERLNQIQIQDHRSDTRFFESRKPCSMSPLPWPGLENSGECLPFHFLKSRRFHSEHPCSTW